MEMEQNYTSIMLMTQAVMSNLTSTAGSRNVDTPKESFKQLLERRQERETVPEAETETLTKPAKTTPEAKEENPVEEDAVVQEQIVAAAMAAMQNSVVVVDLSNAPMQVEPEVMQLVESAPQSVDVVTAENTAELAAAAKTTENSLAGNETGINLKMQQITDGAEFRTAGRPTAIDHNGYEQAEIDVDENQHQGDMETPVFHDVKEVMVKVSDVSTAEDAEQTGPLKEQVVRQVSAALEQGESRITVQLTPHNLGRVEIELTHAKDGSMQVTLRAENRMTQQLLEKESAGLQTALMRSTQQEVQVEVPRQQEGHRQSFEDDRQQGHQQNPQQEQKGRRNNSSDFLNQLRLGLVPLNAEAS